MASFPVVCCKSLSAGGGFTFDWLDRNIHRIRTHWELYNMKFKELLILSTLFAAGTASANIPGGTVNASLQNGNFSTGNFTDWTVAPTSNGSLGGGLPIVTTFNVTGSGSTTAAEFEVGEVLNPGSGVQQGGSLSQNIVTGAGDLVFNADVAVTTSSNNQAGGDFSVLLDGVTLDTFDVGYISVGDIDRGVLSFSDVVSAGTHDLEILITRPYGNNNTTPLEYVTNVTASVPGPGSTVPEPASLALVALGLFGLAWSQRKKA